MVQRAMHFTPQVLLSAPRRSAGVPNPSGTKVLYTTSTYSFETHKKSVEFRVLDVKTGESHLLAKDDEISDPNWLNEDEFACLQAEKDGRTSIYIASVRKCLEDLKKGESHYIAGKIDAPAGNLRVCKLDEDSDDFGVAVSAQASPDGSLFTLEKASRKTQSTGRLYTGLFVRHWDTYETKEKNALWYGKLSKGADGKYSLSKLSNALKGTSLECPVPPFGGTDSFDISRRSIIFVSKDPKLNPALNVKCNVYVLRLKSWNEGTDPKQIQQVQLPGWEGAKTSPVFGPQGNGAAFLAMKQPGYEADKNRIFVIADVGAQQAELTAKQVLSHDGGETWDRSPQSVCFSMDGQSLLATAEDEGYGKLFKIDIESVGQQPGPLTRKGYIGDARPLSDGRIFVTGSSLVDNSLFAIVDPRSKASSLTTWSHSHSAEGSKYGLKHSQVSSIWTPASNSKIRKEIHSWVVKPSKFDSSKKYPVAYLIHGGPQGSWGDSWSTRWNPAVFAEQGYIVVAPNPTGSTGYGQELTDSIQKNWGGDPYQDIVNCFEWVGKNMPEADNEKAVALGASYGGYMMNWIQGHDLGRKFKALVCHDGIFSMAGSMLGSEEIYFPFHDLGGTPWYDPGFDASKDPQAVASQAHNNFGASTFSDWRRWDPSEHLVNWATPQLVIHSSKDYRLPISEGLAAFNVLQARGVESQFLCFPDENHWVLKPENSLAWHKVVLNWINHYVGLPRYSEEDPESEEFWGGVRGEKEEVTEMHINQGKPET